MWPAKRLDAATSIRLDPNNGGYLSAQGLAYDQVKRQLVEQEQSGQADSGMVLTLAADTGHMLVELASAQCEVIAAQREPIAMRKAEVERLSGAWAST